MHADTCPIARNAPEQFCCRHVFVSICFDVLCFDCVLVRRLEMTGTLDPVRNLTGLATLVLSQNSIGGMFVRTAVGTNCGASGCVCVWMAVV